jgi:preprotein translocase subunit SecA
MFKNFRSSFQNSHMNNIFFNSDMKMLNEKLAQIRRINLSTYTDAKLLDLSQELFRQAQNGSSLDDLLVESFALVNEAIYRVLGITAFDVQILAGIVLHKGKLIEMQTGEGIYQRFFKRNKSID